MPAAFTAITSRNDRQDGPVRRSGRPALLLLCALVALLGCVAIREGGGATWQPPRGHVQKLALDVRVLGRGEPTIVLLHGLAGSNRYFGAKFDALSSEGRLVVPDLLGFGGSPRPATGAYDAKLHAAAVSRALDQLGTEGPIYLVSHSAGAVVALEVARLRGPQVRGVVAFNPPLYSSGRAARSHIGRLGLLTRIFLEDGALARVACAVMCTFRSTAATLIAWLRPSLPEPIAMDAVEHSWVSYSRTLRKLVVESQPPRMIDLRSTPIWLVAAADDALMETRFLVQLARAPNVHLDIWSGGHDLPLSRPFAAVAAIRRALNRTSVRSSVHRTRVSASRGVLGGASSTQLRPGPAPLGFQPVAARRRAALPRVGLRSRRKL